MKDKQGLNSENDPCLCQTDKELESDIKHLKRSTNLYTLLGTLVIILFFVLFGYKYYLKASAVGAPAIKTPNYITIGYIQSEDAKIMAEPRVDAQVVARMNKGESIFILEKEGDWRRVHKQQAEGAYLVGWMKASWLRSLEELKAAIQEMADSPIEILQNVQWIVDEVENFTIIGKVRNTSEIPIRNIRIAIEFYDDDGSQVDRKIVYVNPKTPLLKGAPKDFFLTGKQKASYNYVKYSLESFD